MKRILTSALVLALTIGAAQAQSSTSDKAKADKKEQKDGKHDKAKGFGDVNLTEDQKARLQSIRENYKKEAEALRNNTTLTAEQKQVERKKLHEKIRTESASILTPEQKQQMEEMRSERGAHAKGKFDKGDRMSKAHKGDHDKMKAKGEEIKKDLNLTADQEAKMKQVRESYKAKFEALSTEKLTQDERRAKAKELMQAQQEEMKSILTKEQQEKMQSLKKDRTPKKAK